MAVGPLAASRIGTAQCRRVQGCERSRVRLIGRDGPFQHYRVSEMLPVEANGTVHVLFATAYVPASVDGIPMVAVSEPPS